MGTAFRLEELDGKIGLLTFDLPGQSVNTFGQPVLQELENLLGELEKHSDLKGLLLKSGKPGQFIAGADLTSSACCVCPEGNARNGSGARPQSVHASQPPAVPTVSLINGNCMGGGTELSLAIDYRLAADNTETKIGLPEVESRPHPRLGRHAAFAAASSACITDPDDLLGRTGRGDAERPRSAWSSTRSLPNAWSTTDAG